MPQALPAAYVQSGYADPGKRPYCIACDDATMVEYGNGISKGPYGQVGGSNGGGGADLDWGAQLIHSASGAVDTIVRLPTEQLVLLVVAVFIGLWVLKRAL